MASKEPATKKARTGSSDPSVLVSTSSGVGRGAAALGASSGKDGTYVKMGDGISAAPECDAEKLTSVALSHPFFYAYDMVAASCSLRREKWLNTMTVKELQQLYKTDRDKIDDIF